MRITGIAAALVVAFCGVGELAAKEVPTRGFSTADMAVAQVAQPYLIAEQATVRPQVGYAPLGPISVYGGP